MSIKFSNGPTYNDRYNHCYNGGTDGAVITKSRRLQMALNTLDNFCAPQDSYTPRYTSASQDVSSQGIYSPRDFDRNVVSQAQRETNPVQKATPVARPAAAAIKAAPKKKTGVNIKPLKQSNRKSCGQTSVAMSVNFLTGKKLTDRDIDTKYGFNLLPALNAESRGSGYKWDDNGTLSKKSWPAMERRLNREKTPVLLGLNGQFSASGRGHIVTLMSIDGNKVTYADPADGKIKTTTKQAIENAPGHPQGKFMFVASKV